MYRDGRPRTPNATTIGAPNACLTAKTNAASKLGSDLRPPQYIHRSGSAIVADRTMAAVTMAVFNNLPLTMEALMDAAADSPAESWRLQTDNDMESQEVHNAMARIQSHKLRHLCTRRTGSSGTVHSLLVLHLTRPEDPSSPNSNQLVEATKAITLKRATRVANVKKQFRGLTLLKNVQWQMRYDSETLQMLRE